MAEAKTAYFKALREEVPEFDENRDGRGGGPPELDTFAAAFAIAGENQERTTDEKILILLKRFSRNPDIEKGEGRIQACSKRRREIP